MTVPDGVVIGFLFTGPWKPVSGGGRARRGLSVIVVKKIDVNVNSTGVLGTMVISAGMSVPRR
jgi:hypothetical protein